jgi:hypothetical protein
MATADVHKHATGGQYQEFIARFRKALHDKLVTAADAYLLDDESLDDFDKLVLGRAKALDGGPMLVSRFDWDALAKAAAAISPKDVEAMRGYRDTSSMYDATIIVPSSPIDQIRP